MAEVLIDDGKVMQLVSTLLDSVNAAVPVWRPGQAVRDGDLSIAWTKMKISRVRRAGVDPSTGGAAALALLAMEFELLVPETVANAYAPGTGMAYLAAALDCRCAREVDSFGAVVAGGHVVEMDALEWEMVSPAGDIGDDERIRMATAVITGTVRRTAGSAITSYLS